MARKTEEALPRHGFLEKEQAKDKAPDLLGNTPPKSVPQSPGKALRKPTTRATPSIMDPILESLENKVSEASQ